MNTEWLTKLCNPEDIRPICQKPYGITVDSIRWDFAGNGHVLCAIKDTTGYPDYGSESFASQSSTHKQITDMLQHDGDYQIATLDSLRQWAGDPLPSCSTCDSYGLSDCPGGCDEFGCERCGYDGNILCPDCKGESSPYNNIAYGLINNVLINRNLIATAFHHLDDGQVRVLTSGEESGVYFISATWRVIVMPIRGGAEHNVEEMAQAVRFNEWSNLANAG